MPAVSTSRTVRPSTSIGVSIASRVVPARSETITRSRPRKALTSEDLPTFGRPMTASRTSPSSSSGSSPSGSSSTRRSSRSPVPSPCTADTAIGSPSPRPWKSWTSPKSRGESILFATSTTGSPPLRRRSATSASPARKPARPSTTSTATSASASASRTWSWIETASGSVSSRSTPPVSIRAKLRPFQSVASSLRSRVMPEVSCTTASRDCVRRLTSEDLPTFGKPTTAIFLTSRFPSPRRRA